MAENETQRTLIDLDDAAMMLEHPGDDIRGRRVYDGEGQELGAIDGLIIDEAESKVRFLRIGSVDFSGSGSWCRWTRSPASRTAQYTWTG
ncbi:PRC-barrel domain-containing protein [Rhodococcus opacus]|uniref:PRC-barrel domain-containing protein n=1 Tax=Rhodococcus opacus TaxID=37919 RepID=UPI0018C8A2D4|nr:PRC-barrel domain-containing protein [Rhodococcus opacus]